MDREELAWCAGFFDGEGNACIKGKRSRAKQRATTNRPLSVQICVQIRQCDRRVLDRFRDAVGVGSVHGPYPPTGFSKQDQYQYRATRFREAMHVVAVLWPFLGEVKREQFRECFLIHHEYQRERRRAWLCGHARKPGETQCRSCVASGQRALREARRCG